MNTLRDHLDDYLTIRRAMGYKLVGEARMLVGFVTFAEQLDASAFSTDTALEWATAAVDASAGWAARRLRAVRTFARYLQTINPACEVPPSGLLPGRNRRPAPHLYSDDDVVALMAAARQLRPALRAATHETLIGLLASTGMRIGEAMRLDNDDIDWTNAVLTIRDSKFGKSREVLIDLSTLEALRTYMTTRDRLCRHPRAVSVFVTTRGTRLGHTAVEPTFRTLIAAAGLRRPTSTSRPRIHDLRHTFAVNTLIGWYRDGCDVAVRLPLLSTYLGHVDPAATYWYLSAAPELLALAADRLELRIGAIS